MNRRYFIALLGGAAAVWPLAARAQQPLMPVVGFVNAGTSDAPLGAAFRKGLNEAGYIEGQNVTVEYHWLDGQFDRLPALMAELVRRRVAVIATPAGNLASLAAKAATTTTPIVFGVSEDPVKLGLVASLARPGGNLTGVNFFATELEAKRLALLHELVPKAVRIAVLVNPANIPATESQLRDLPNAARAIGLQIQVLKASTRSEIERPSPPSCASAPTLCTSLATCSSPAGAPQHATARQRENLGSHPEAKFPSEKAMSNMLLFETQVRDVIFTKGSNFLCSMLGMTGGIGEASL
jgi:putative ABC transport system substrate-binding protein